MLRASSRRLSQFHVAGVRGRCRGSSSAEPCSPTFYPAAYSKRNDQFRTVRTYATVNAHDEDPHFSHMDKVTSIELLSPKVMPLGSMNDSQMDDVIAAIEFWCNIPSGYAMDAADRLLHRLYFEHASHSAVAQRHQDYIFQLHNQVIQAWLAMESFPAALTRAEEVLARIIEWHNRGLVTGELPFQEMVILVKLWVVHEVPSNAARNLIRASEISDSEDELTPLFSDVLKQCVEVDDRITAISLCERIEYLQSECGWENLAIDEELRKFVSDEEPIHEEDSTTSGAETQDAAMDDCETVPSLSPSEIKIAANRIVEFLKQASTDDEDKVLEMTQQFEDLPLSSEMTLDVCRAFVEYYTRIKNAKQATRWLQRMDVDLDNVTEVSGMDCFNGVLEVWAKSSEKEAPWRAQELVQRMEQLEERGLLQVTTDSYNLLTEAWLNSDESVAPRKVQEIMRMNAAKEEGDESKSPNLESQKTMLQLPNQDPVSLAESTLAMLDQREEIGDEELSRLVEESLETLAKERKDDLALRILRKTVWTSLPVTESMCANLMKAHQGSKKVMSVLDALQFLEGLPNISLPLVCHQVPIVVALEATGYSIERKEKIVSNTLHSYSLGKLRADANEMHSLMERITKELAFQGRYAMEMLALFERLILSDDALKTDLVVPVGCFNSVLQVLSSARELEKVEETFNRLLSYYQAGHTSMLPNTTSFFHFLSCLSKANGMAQKADDLLSQMLDLHKATGDDTCKPNDRCFHAVMIAWRKQGGIKAFHRSSALLDQMLALNVPVECFTFNTIIVTAADADCDGLLKYKAAIPLLSRMKQLGIEPDFFTDEAILRVCRYAGSKKYRSQALAIAMEAMGRLRQNGTADHKTYFQFITALRNVLREEPNQKREKIVSAACRLCHQDGLLDEANERAFRSTMGDEAWNRLSKTFSPADGNSMVVQ